MIKGSILQKDVIIINTYAPKIRALKYIRQKLMDLTGENDKSTLTVKDFQLNNC